MIKFNVVFGDIGGSRHKQIYTYAVKLINYNMICLNKFFFGVCFLITNSAPLGQVGLVVAMSMYLSLCVPYPYNFFRMAEARFEIKFTH